MIILKVGGGKDINWDHIARDIAGLKEQVIIVHGANYLMKDTSARLGVRERIITSPSGHVSRHTDEKTMEILLMTYCGLMNKKIVSILQKHGINAIGLTGADGKLLLGVRKKAILSEIGGKVKVIRDSKTGNIKSVNTKLISLLLENGFIPVVTIPAITEEGELINVDNDRIVAMLAKELKVETIVMLFEAAGLLSDKKDASSKIDRIDKNEIEDIMKTTEGRMRKKLLGVKEAISYGVKSVYFGDGRIEKPLTSTLAGKGTLIN
ncbi:[LysW]-aminoadipate kinase [Candidatus Gottesmanbacteria bacterium]|nr:[LysW]-aminoadipate kinase [Candidatus Gottesmanbacteria bacterium]